MKQISFLINTSVNTLNHFKVLIESLKLNLKGKNHEIVVFIDSDNEGTLDWLRKQKQYFFDLKIITHKLKPCVGYSRNNNLLVELAKHDIVSYLQSDMVISPNYDEDVLSEIEDNCILSATRVEPPLHGISHTVITKDFGVDPKEFSLESWNEFSISVKEDKTIEYFFAPITFYKQVWINLGGYDTQFRRGREDSDLLQRFIQAGVKIKQTFKANVYHFTCVSSRGKNWFDKNNTEAKRRLEIQKVADRIELNRFIKKWGSFNHGESKLNKLDIDLVVLNEGANLNLVTNIEPFFSRIWLKEEKQKAEILQLLSNQQGPANELLGFSEKDWQDSEHLYNQIDFGSIYNTGQPDTWNIKIDVDLNSVNPNSDPFLQNIINITSIIENSEPGVYELGCARIDIQALVSVSKDLVICKNPPFDLNLLVIE